MAQAQEQAQTERVGVIADELMALLGTGRQTAPFSQHHPALDIAEAYAIVARVDTLRRARGETPKGRKIGFTNPEALRGFRISGPIWNFMYDSTVHDAADAAFPLTGLCEPRIEPEVVLHLAKAPRAGMSDADLLSCVDWIAPGYEIVHSIFPGWKFTPADAVAAYGFHGALLLGAKREVDGEWLAKLSSFSVDLTSDSGVSRAGHARNVLGSPLKSLGRMLEEIDRYPACETLRAGEIVTTGTLTEAMPIAPGETWTTRFDGIGLEPLRVRFR